jgi:hypothetical protein
MNVNRDEVVNLYGREFKRHPSYPQIWIDVENGEHCTRARIEQVEYERVVAERNEAYQMARAARRRRTP